MSSKIYETVESVCLSHWSTAAVVVGSAGTKWRRLTHEHTVYLDSISPGEQSTTGRPVCVLFDSQKCDGLTPDPWHQTWFSHVSAWPWGDCHTGWPSSAGFSRLAHSHMHHSLSWRTPGHDGDNIATCELSLLLYIVLCAWYGALLFRERWTFWQSRHTSKTLCLVLLSRLQRENGLRNGRQWLQIWTTSMPKG